MQEGVLDYTVLEFQENHRLSLSSYSVALRRTVVGKVARTNTQRYALLRTDPAATVQRDDDQKRQCKDYEVAREL